LTLSKAINEDGVKLVSQFILEKINTDGFRDTLAYQILSRLSHSLSRLPYPSGQQPDNFDDHRRDTEAAPALLEDLSRLLREKYLDGAETEGKMNKKNTQRGKTQRSKVTSVAHAEINDRLFQALGRESPRSRESAEELIQSIITTQKNTLKVRFPPSPSSICGMPQHLVSSSPLLCEPPTLQGWFEARTFARTCFKEIFRFLTNKLPPRRRWDYLPP
jgi:hypothetical protein